MRNLILILIFSTLITSCEKDDLMILETSPDIEIRKRPDNVNICHFDTRTKNWSLMSIRKSEIKMHRSHGDIFDMDGDGYFESENQCGMPIDCDDLNFAVKECCFCGYLDDMKFDQNSMFCDWNMNQIQDYLYYESFETWICSNFKSNKYRYVYVWARNEKGGLKGGCEIFDMGENMRSMSKMSYQDAMACRKMLIAHARHLGLKNECAESNKFIDLPEYDECFEMIVMEN